MGLINVLERIEVLRVLVLDDSDLSKLSVQPSLTPRKASYFAESALADTPEEREMEEVDFAIEINGLSTPTDRPVSLDTVSYDVKDTYGGLAASSTHGKLEGVVKGRKEGMWETRQVRSDMRLFIPLHSPVRLSAGSAP
jgi:hypothetical protein